MVYGDSYLDLDFNKAYSYFLNTNNKPTMCVYKNINNLIQNNINLNGDKVLEYNKLTPKTNFNFVDYGMSFIPTRLLREFPTTNPRFDLSDFFQFLVGKKLLRGYKVGSRFYEIGSLAGIKELSDKMESKWNI